MCGGGGVSLCAHSNLMCSTHILQRVKVYTPCCTSAGCLQWANLSPLRRRGREFHPRQLPSREWMQCQLSYIFRYTHTHTHTHTHTRLSPLHLPAESELSLSLEFQHCLGIMQVKPVNAKLGVSLWHVSSYTSLSCIFLSHNNVLPPIRIPYQTSYFVVFPTV